MVNIPEDVIRVGEPSEVGEQVIYKLLILHSKLYIYVKLQMSVMAGAMSKMYGAATMAGKDERNGRINPALEADDDLPVMEAQRQIQEISSERVEQFKSSGGGKGRVEPNIGLGGQGHTQF